MRIQGPDLAPDVADVRLDKTLESGCSLWLEMLHDADSPLRGDFLLRSWLSCRTCRRERARARACERERGRERWERPVVQEYGVVYVCIVGGVVYVCIVCAVVSAAAVSGL